MQGIVPGAFFKTAIGPDHWLEDAAPVIDGFPDQKPALDTGLAPIHGAFFGGNRADDPPPLQAKSDQATLGAKRAKRIYLAVKSRIIISVFFGQRARRADIEAGAAELAVGVQQPPAERGSDRSSRTAVEKGQSRSPPDFGADPDAPSAENAKIIIAIKERIVRPDVEIPAERGESGLIRF